MEVTKSLILVIAITTLGYTGQKPKGLSSDELKQRHVRGIDLTNVTATNAFTSILNAAHAPGGVATITACGDAPTHNLTPTGSTLSEALDSIVLAHPQYRWYIDQGVVNLVPSDDVPPLLEVQVGEFEIRPTETIDAMLGKLLMTPEVQHGIAQLQLKREIGLASLERPGFKRVEEDDGSTFRYQNLTVRKALNAIARAHGNAVWNYREQRCNAEDKFSIGFLVE
jgi:hypothetical protein